MSQTSSAASAVFHEDWYPEYKLQGLRRLCEAVRGQRGAAVEVGCWEGRSTRVIADAFAPDRIHAVDHWRGNETEGADHPSVVASRHRDVFATFCANMEALTAGNIDVFRMGWQDYFREYARPMRFLHIDAGHDHASVKANIDVALPLMLPGSIMCGDDFASAHAGRHDLDGGVERAVRESFARVESLGDLWWTVID